MRNFSHLDIEKMKHLFTSGITIIITLAALTSMAALKATIQSDTLVDPQALTIKGKFGQAINGKSFQQDAIVSHNGYQYVGYYGGDRDVCLARRKLPSGKWEILRFQDYNFKSNDAHNTISIGICPKDGTIHVAFDHHVNPLHYRRSKRDVATKPDTVKWEASLFGPIISKLEKDKPRSVTYPRFLQTPDGGLQFCYRRGGSGHGDRMLADYNHATGKWQNIRQIDSGKGLFEDALSKSKSRCSYPNGYTYGPDGKLHTTWVWREHSQGSNHDLIYVYRADKTGDPKTLIKRSGVLQITAATAASAWKDWAIIHTEEGPFVNEMLGDPLRWKESGVLSVMVQKSPAKPHDSTPLRIIDFKFTEED